MRMIIFALLLAISYAQTACEFEVGGEIYDLTPIKSGIRINDTNDASISYFIGFCEDFSIPCNGGVGSTYLLPNSNLDDCKKISRWKRDEITASIPDGEEDLIIQFENGDQCGGGMWKQSIHFVCSHTESTFTAEIDPNDSCHVTVMHKGDVTCTPKTTADPALTTPEHTVWPTTAEPKQVVDVTIAAYMGDDCAEMIPGYESNIRMPLDGNCVIADPDGDSEFFSFRATCIHGSQLTFSHCDGVPPKYYPLGIDLVNGACNEIQLSEIMFSYVKVTWSGDYCQGSSKKIKKHHGFRNAVIALIVIGSILGFLWMLIYGVNFRRKRTISFAGDLQGGTPSYEQMDEEGVPT